MREPDIIWENEDLQALFLVYNHNTCYAAHIVFDVFPFDDLALAAEMLSPFAAVNDKKDDTHVIFIADIEEDIEDLTERTACVILELADHQDDWLFFSPIARLELYGKVLKDAQQCTAGDF